MITLPILTSILWLAYYDYTRKLAIPGMVQSSSELVHVYPQQPGVITRAVLQENKAVAAGSLLFEIDNERQQQGMGVESSVANLLEQRLTLLGQNSQQQWQAACPAGTSAATTVKPWLRSTCQHPA